VQEHREESSADDKYLEPSSVRSTSVRCFQGFQSFSDDVSFLLSEHACRTQSVRRTLFVSDSDGQGEARTVKSRGLDRVCVDFWNLAVKLAKGVSEVQLLALDGCPCVEEGQHFVLLLAERMPAARLAFAVVPWNRSSHYMPWPQCLHSCKCCTRLTDKVHGVLEWFCSVCFGLTNLALQQKEEIQLLRVVIGQFKNGGATTCMHM
jgi:hypothetical protein